MNNRSQIGICATFAADHYDNNVILKHEKTRKEKEDDRTNHIVSTEAQTGVVFLTYRGVPNINVLLKARCIMLPPIMILHRLTESGILCGYCRLNITMKL